MGGIRRYYVPNSAVFITLGAGFPRPLSILGISSRTLECGQVREHRSQ